jgi:Raf kinase inhibitor-like YbhB/YbcL family protein
MLKVLFFLAFGAITTIAATLLCKKGNAKTGVDNNGNMKKIPHFSVTSSDITDGQTLANAHVYSGCGGANLSPQLAWSGLPNGTKSIAITAYDPDAPTGSGWWHWLAFNIPADVEYINTGVNLKQDVNADIIEGRNDYGEYGYGGACPPEGDPAHNYIFTIWALDVAKLDLDDNASAATIGFHLNVHAIAKGQISATYGR